MSDKDRLKELQKKYGDLPGALAFVAEQESKTKKELFTGLVIYPINGRAVVPDALAGHWSYRRDEVVRSLLPEIFEQESEYSGKQDEIFDLLMKNDRVRVGRIVAQIIHMEKSIDIDGVEVLDG